MQQVPPAPGLLQLGPVGNPARAQGHPQQGLVGQTLWDLRDLPYPCESRGCCGGGSRGASSPLQGAWGSHHAPLLLAPWCKVLQKHPGWEGLCLGASSPLALVGRGHRAAGARAHGDMGAEDTRARGGSAPKGRLVARGTGRISPRSLQIWKVHYSCKAADVFGRPSGLDKLF